jgi:hypothetical protein
MDASPSTSSVALIESWSRAFLTSSRLTNGHGPAPPGADPCQPPATATALVGRPTAWYCWVVTRDATEPHNLTALEQAAALSWRATVGWYKNNRDWWEPLKSR